MRQTQIVRTARRRPSVEEMPADLPTAPAADTSAAAALVATIDAIIKSADNPKLHSQASG